MREELMAISYSSRNGTTLNIWKMLEILQEIHKVNFWDYYGSDSDFYNWCDSKGYGEFDSSGDDRGSSNIWFAEYQSDVENGLWTEMPYCPFIDMFREDIEDLGNDSSEDIYTVDLKRMLKDAKKEDKKEFGQDDYRVRLTSLLIDEFGDILYVDQTE